AGDRREDVRGGGRRHCFFFSSRRRHTRCSRDWSSDVCSSDLDSLGLKSLRLTTAAGVFTTAAAINVVEPLSPLAVYSDNPDSTTVSDTGGDKITLQLQGAGTGLRVYWLPAEDGFQVEETFRVTHALNG